MRPAPAAAEPKTPSGSQNKQYVINYGYATLLFINMDPAGRGQKKAALLSPRLYTTLLLLLLLLLSVIIFVAVVARHAGSRVVLVVAVPIIKGLHMAFDYNP